MNNGNIRDRNRKAERERERGKIEMGEGKIQKWEETMAEDKDREEI